jgi:hypothetical protein
MPAYIKPKQSEKEFLFGKTENCFSSSLFSAFEYYGSALEKIEKGMT